MDEKKVRGMVFGYVCLANGSIAFMCASCLSMVHAVAAAVPAVHLNSADHDLDIEHYSYLLCLAITHTWTAMGGSGMDCPVGIWVRGSSCCNYRFSPHQPIGKPSMLNGPGKAKPVPDHVNL